MLRRSAGSSPPLTGMAATRTTNPRNSERVKVTLWIETRRRSDQDDMPAARSTLTRALRRSFTDLQIDFRPLVIGFVTAPTLALALA